MVVFPAPDGAEKIIILPFMSFDVRFLIREMRELENVEHLLLDLFEFILHLNHHLLDIGIVSL